MSVRILRRYWILGVAALVAVGAVFRVATSRHEPKVHAAVAKGNSRESNGSRTAGTAVRVVKPSTGGIERTTTQPGTVESFDFADLFAKVSGYLSRQDVDIGDKVTKGQVIAELSVPELREELRQAKAALTQAHAQVEQMTARVATAEADFEAATAMIERSKADLKHAEATRSFRKKQFDRITELFELKSIDERLVDEKEEQLDAALAAESAAQAAIITTKAQAGAAKARIASAQADLADAQSRVQVAEAAVAKAQVFVDYTQIVSPYNGVITRRSFHLGDFIRAADQGGREALLTVARTDKMRVVVQVPERDVPYTSPGNAALVELDALAGKKFERVVSRVANSEDRVTRAMRTEIDIENPDGELRDGMFGRVTIHLDRTAGGLTVPSTALVSEAEGKKFFVFIVRKGRAQRVPVKIGHDSGVRVEILSGLQPDDLVVLRPGNDVKDGTAVVAEEPEAVATDKAGQK
jgi:RND family efflux transporter MFP subunit